MKICQIYHPGTPPVTFARGESQFTDNCSNCDSHPIVPCGYCEGDGFIYHSEIDDCSHEIEGVYPCPECRGSGWVEGEAASLTIDDLDLRAPIESLLKWWSCLAARDAWPEQRQRIAAVCERRLSWHYRVSEC